MNVVSMQNNAADTQTIEGAEEATQKVLKFVKAVVANPEMEGTIEFELLQHGAGQEEDDAVWSAEYAPGDEVNQLVKEVVEAAVEDASGYPNGVLKYVFKAVGVKARVIFSLKVNSTEDEDIEDIDDLPNKRGLISQLMRHQEKIMRIAVGSTQKVIKTLETQNQKKDERIDQLESNQINTIKMIEDLVSGRHVRDLELRKLEREEKHKDQAIGMLMTAMPMLANKLMGGAQGAANVQGSGGPIAGASPIETMVEGLMSSMTSEQFNNLVKSGLFSPDQMMLLAEIARTIQAKQDAAAGGQSASGSPNPGAGDNKS